MNIGWDFLRLEQEKWSESDDQRKLVHYASRIQVTNDLAERAVQLFSLYHGKVTHDETDRQNLMSSVIQQRRNKSNLSRDALTEFYKNKANHHKSRASWTATAQPTNRPTDWPPNRQSGL